MKPEQIKFRGFRTDGNGWVEGFYVYRPDGKHLIYWQPFPESTNNTYHEIHPSSLGMFTGLTDKNGKEIYGAIGEKGGDWIQVASGYISYITFKDAMFLSVYSHPEDGEEIPLLDIIGFKNNIEIIGNQWEQK